MLYPIKSQISKHSSFDNCFVEECMKHYQVVIKVLEENGGFATLGYLNQGVFKKTSFMGIKSL